MPPSDPAQPLTFCRLVGGRQAELSGSAENSAEQDVVTVRRRNSLKFEGLPAEVQHGRPLPDGQGRALREGLAVTDDTKDVATRLAGQASTLLELARAETRHETRAVLLSVASAIREIAAVVDATPATPHVGVAADVEDRIDASMPKAAAALERLGVAVDIESPYRDALTGVLVRSVGREQIGQCLDRAQRTHEPLVVAYVDVDNLAQVNASFGHSAGDALLTDVAMALWTNLRTYDIVVRYGGDEFVCALPGARREDAQRRFDEVAATVARMTLGATVSVGLAELTDADTLDDVVARAVAAVPGGARPRGSAMAAHAD